MPLCSARRFLVAPWDGSPPGHDFAGLPRGASLGLASHPDARKQSKRDAGAARTRGGIKRIARELGVDRKTVKVWRRRGG
jgi:hypothetical protein